MKILFSSYCPAAKTIARCSMVVGAALLWSCSIQPTLVSSGPHKPDDKKVPSGLRYHLAKDVIQVTATRIEKTTRKPKADLSGPETELKMEFQAAAALVTIADPTDFYVIDANPGRWSDSLLTVKASGDGLLQAINSESTGQAGQFVKSLLQAAATVAGAVLLDQAAQGPWPPDRDCRPIANLPAELINRLFLMSGGAAGDPAPSALPKGRTARRFVLSENTACELWQKLELNAYESEMQRSERAELSMQLRAAVVAKDIAALKARMDATQLALTALAQDREIWLATFRSGLEDFEKRFEFGTKTSSFTKNFDFDTDELPPDSIMAGDGDLVDRLRTANWNKAVELFELASYVVTRREVGQDQNQPPQTTHCTGTVPDRKVRLYYRSTEPAIVTVYGPDDDGRLVIKKQELMQLINRKATHCFEFAESGFAVRKLKLEMDPRGRITLLDRSSTSEAKAAGEAIASALTAARDAYSDTLTKVATIQETRRKIGLDDLETELARLKKQKEVADADVGLQGALASRESVLEQQRLTAELAALQARLNLESAQATYANTLEVAGLKAEIEKLKQQLELLKAQLALQGAGGE